MKIKYRVNHYYADMQGQYAYDHIDIDNLQDALIHFAKARTATDIWEVHGNRLYQSINHKTGKPL